MGELSLVAIALGAIYLGALACIYRILEPFADSFETLGETKAEVAA